MATGTPGVYWSVRVEYVLSQRTSGEYYFKSVTKGTITTHKNYLELTWCDYLLVETRNRYHSILSNGSKIRVEADWDFTATISSGGWPVETSWTEYHYHDKNVSDVTP